DVGALQEVCASAPLSAADVIDVLTRLAEKSMVQVESGAHGLRYRLLETIREYAAEKLDDEGLTSELRDRHLSRYRRLANEAWEAQKHRGARREHRGLWREMDDVRAAISWAAADPEDQLRLVGNLYILWMVYAPAEGFDLASQLLQGAAGKSSAGRLSAGYVYSALGGITGRDDAGFLAPGDLAAIAVALDDKYLVAHQELGMAYFAERQLVDLQMAENHIRRAVAQFEEIEAGPSLAMAMGSLGSILMQRGRPAEARPWIERAVRLAADVDDPYGAIGANFHLGHWELEHGTRAAARDAFLAGLKNVDDGDRLSLTYQVTGVACAIALEDAAFALRLFAACAQLRAREARPLGLPWGPRVDLGVAEARSALRGNAADQAWQAGEALSAERLLEEVWARFPPAGQRTARAPAALSKRELEVAGLVASGMTSRAIAEKLFLSERTVETHLTHIMTKLSVNSRAQVAAWVASRGAAEGT
ncbi:MAG: LuxR C-terminal-related transcriptional regulator, partial [Candidatus Dormibacteria bacterium]